MKFTWRVYGIIFEGGVKFNIIFDRSQFIYYFRIFIVEDLKVLKEKVVSCFEVVGIAIGIDNLLFGICYLMLLGYKLFFGMVNKLF